MKNSDIFNRRLFLLLIGKIFLFFILLSRMFFLQIKENFYFNSLSDKNKTSYIPIIPKRGNILDKFNLILADNMVLWEAVIIKSQIKSNINLFINTISSIIVLNDESKEKILKEYKSKPSHYIISIKQKLSPSEIASLETFSYNIPAIFIRPFYRRYYPLEDTFAHLIGYTSLSDTLAKTKNIPNWYIGKYGLELILDPFLKGDIGYLKYEINAYGHIVKKLEETQSKSGNNVSLTIDASIQQSVYDILSKYNSGSVSVVDLTTGNIIALVSYPSFNPNLFTENIPSNIWNGLLNNPKSPLLNKPLMGLYPPGSTIKPIIALEALQKGYITKDTEVQCNGHIEIGKEKFHCWLPKGHGKVNVSKALYLSCDVFFYELAKTMSSKDINNVASNFGFHQKHLPIVDNESKGRLLDDNLKLGDRIVSIIGQGKWLATPIQLLKMVSLIATKGKNLNFNILKNIDYENQLIYPKNKAIENNLISQYKEEYLDLIKNAYFNTVNLKEGTGVLSKTYDNDWILNGKTGTAQVKRISLEERLKGITANHMLPWELRDHALFVSFVPFDEPLYAISVVIEHGGGGSTIAGPIAKKVAMLLKNRHQAIYNDNQKINNIINNIKK